MPVRSSTKASRPADTPVDAAARPERLVKVNSAQIKLIRRRYQERGESAARPAKATGRPLRRTAGEAPERKPSRAAELRFRRLAVELGMVRAKALVAEVEQQLAALASR